MISTGTAGQKELLPPHANKWTGGDGYGTPEKLASLDGPSWRDEAQATTDPKIPSYPNYPFDVTST